MVHVFASSPAPAGAVASELELGALAAMSFERCVAYEEGSIGSDDALHGLHDDEASGFVDEDDILAPPCCSCQGLVKARDGSALRIVAPLVAAAAAVKVVCSVAFRRTAVICHKPVQLDV